MRDNTNLERGDEDNLEALHILLIAMLQFPSLYLNPHGKTVKTFVQELINCHSHKIYQWIVNAT